MEMDESGWLKSFVELVHSGDSANWNALESNQVAKKQKRRAGYAPARLINIALFRLK